LKVTNQDNLTNSTKIVNAMSVDVEDYFQVSAFERYIQRKDWETIPTRVEQNVDKLLSIFSDNNVKATFFILGWIAERHPEMIKRIADDGHEVASHGYSHTRIVNLSKDQFREDIMKTNGILGELANKNITGYRAPSYSISLNNLWAHDILEECGFKYSSSIYPIKHDIYGIPGSPRFSYRVASGNLLEIPISTLKIFNRIIPCGGGGYFRFYPYLLSRYMINRLNISEKQPCIFYFHPWEIDIEQPRQTGLDLKTSFRHYLNIDRMESRLRSLLRDFSWGRIDRIFSEHITE